MKKLFYATICCLVTLALWQCKDQVWKRAAIGTIGASELTFLSDGVGTQELEFSTTVGWSASIAYTSGDTTGWCSISPQSGGAGETTMKVTVKPSNSYDNRVAMIKINAGGAVQEYKVTVRHKGVIDPEKDAFEALGRGDTVAIPMERNVECKVVIPKSVTWISQIAVTKAAPIKDTIYLKISPSTEIADRSSLVGFQNSTFKVVREIQITQHAQPLLSITPDSVSLTGKDQTTSLKLKSTGDWKITADSVQNWCTIDRMSDTLGEYMLKVHVTQTLYDTRMTTFTATCDTMVRKIKVNQKELGEENGVYLSKLPSISSFGWVSGSSQLNAFNLFTPTKPKDAKRVIHGNAGRGPHDLFKPGESNPSGKIAQKLTLDYPIQKLEVGTCTWSNTQGKGVMTFKLWVWNKDYATTTAQVPLRDTTITYEDNAQTQLLPDNFVLPMGNYLYEMKGLHKYSGIWKYTETLKGFECFIEGESSSTAVPDATITYAATPQVALSYQNSTDNGQTWSAVSYPTLLNFVTTNSKAKASNIEGSCNASTGQLYTTFVMDKNVFVIRNNNDLSAEWQAWTGQGWGGVLEAKPVWTNGEVIHMAFDGNKAYAYSMEDSVTLVVTTASGDDWPGQINTSGSHVTYKFKEEPTSVSVQRVGNQFELLWFGKNRHIFNIQVAPGIDFQNGNPERVVKYIFNGAKHLSRVFGNDMMLYTRDVDGLYIITK